MSDAEPIAPDAGGAEGEPEIPDMLHPAHVTITEEDYKNLKLSADRGRRLAADALNNDAAVIWKRSRRMREFRGDILDRFRRIHGEVTEVPDSYHSTFQVGFGVHVVSRGGQAWALAAPTLNTPHDPLVARAFSFGLYDTAQSWLGSPHLVQAHDTNLQNGGMTLHNDEMFIVEAVSARFRGLRVRYPDADIDKLGLAPGSAAHRMVMGAANVWNRDEVLPRGLRQQLRQVVSELTLHFEWRDSGIGGSNVTTNAFVCDFASVPGAPGIAPIGGERVRSLLQGYVWCLDKTFQASTDMGGNGLFSAELVSTGPGVVPFRPVPIFGLKPGIATLLVEDPPPPQSAAGGGKGLSSAAPREASKRTKPAKLRTKEVELPSGIPAALALIWEIRLHGTSLLPGRRDHRPLEPRREF